MRTPAAENIPNNQKTHGVAPWSIIQPKKQERRRRFFGGEQKGLNDQCHRPGKGPSE